MKQLVTTHELAGNYTIVIDTVKDKLYLDVLDCERPGITMEVNMQGSLMMDVSDMFRKYNIKKYPDVYEISDSVTGKEDLYSSIDTVKYRARTIRVNDDQLRVFAPIILQTDEQIPDVFVLYRRDLSVSKEKLEDNDYKDEIVAVVDLHRNNIAEYIQPKEYSMAYIHGNSRYIKGIDSENGQFVKADLYSDSIVKEEKATEKLIYQSYKDKLLLYNSIVNISFVVKDDKIYEHRKTHVDVDCEDTSAYLYWGRYATLNNIDGIDSITIESSWGTSEDTRDNIFVYKIQSDLQKPMIELNGLSNPVQSLGSKDILLRHHNGGYESITFNTLGGADLKYGEEYKSKYVDVDRTTYTIDSYIDMLPSMSFEYPTSECSLSILMSLNDEFVRYFNATSRIDIKWVKSIGTGDDASHCILLNGKKKEQIQKLKNILGTYFNVKCNLDVDSKPIITVTSRGDNVLNFKYLKFTKTSRLNLIGVYNKIEIDNGNPRLHLYEYSFTSKDTYAKVSREDASDFLSYAKSKYLELADIDNTCVHDTIHECFADDSFYYVRTGKAWDDDKQHYLCGGVLEGNTLSFYNMKASKIYTISPIKVCDFVDIRTAYLADNEPVGVTDDSMPVDVKTRVTWCDYSSVDKNGDSLVPSVASPTGIIDVYSAASSKDSWSYGQILYNAYESSYREGEADASYFKRTCFSSDNIENAYLLSIFGDCFEAYPKYSDKNKLDFIKIVMSLICYGVKNDDNNKFSEDTYTPLLIFEEQPESICLASRLKSAIKDRYTYLLNDGNNNAMTMDDVMSILTKMGGAMADLSINTASKTIKQYLTECSADVLKDITVSVNPVLYDNELFCMLYGVPFKTDIKYSEYTFRSIIVPCSRFLLRLNEDTEVYSQSITEFAINKEAKAFTIVTFLDIPVVMPFAMKTEDYDGDLTLSTAFGYFDRNMLQLIGNGEGIQHVGDPGDEQPVSYSVKAFDTGYIKSTSYLSNNYTYKLNKTCALKMSGINYIDPETYEADIHKYLVDNNKQSLPETHPAVKAARAIVTNSGIRLAILGYASIADSSGAAIYPSKVVLFDSNDNDMKNQLGYFYTISANKEESNPAAYAKLAAAGIKDRNIDFYTIIETDDSASVATMIAYDAVYNNGVRAISKDTIGRNTYKCVAVVITVIDPKKISKDTWEGDMNADWKTALKNTIEYGGAYYYFNSLMSSGDYIKEYVSGKDTFIQTKSGKLNSAIIEVIQAQCYPSSNQIFTYDIVDGVATSSDDSYIHMDDNSVGLLYEQYLSRYNSLTDSIDHVRTQENIFDTSAPLTFVAGDSMVAPILNYRTQRFVSLVVYDRRYVLDKDTDPIHITSLGSVPSILSSKYYVTNGEWINYKNNRSSVDVKLYPSILYGKLLQKDLKSFFKKICDSSTSLDNDDIIMYADTFMFHLYEYDLTAYYDTDSTDFALVSNTNNSSQLDYDVKKGYEQEYKNLPKRNMFFTYKMSLR